MSQHPFLAFVAFQQEVLSFQRRNLDVAARALAAGEDMVAFQLQAHEAAMAGAKAWTVWIDAWTPKS